MSLEFNEDQQQALDRAARRGEAERLAPVMRQNFGEQTGRWSEPALVEEIAAALDRAAHWGIQTRSASTDFVILWLLIGAHFDESFEVGDFLRSGPATAIDAKVQALMADFKWRLLQAGEQ